MKQGMRRGMASLGLLLAITSCTDPPVVPGRGTSGDPVGTPPTGPGAVTPDDPGARVASIAVTPEAVEINAPHYESDSSDIGAPSSDGSDLEHESAGFPTTALLAVTFRTESGEIASPAELLWTSSNPQLVTVDDYGWVQASDTDVSGVATVTARLKRNPLVSASATVTVRNDGMLAIELK